MRTRAAVILASLGIAAVVIAPALPASAKQVTNNNLKAITKAINSGKHLTYQATYTSVSNGQTTTVTIAQAPPKSNFSSSTGSVISDGKSTYYCSSSGGKEQCLTVSGANPLLGLEDLFSPQVALGALAEAKEGLVSKALGISTTQTSASFAGQPSTCVTVTVRGKAGKYCVTNKGLLAYAGSSSSSYFQLTKYSSSPSSSLFSLPAGATTVTLPGGVSIP
jgi:hypothetical protein